MTDPSAPAWRPTDAAFRRSEVSTVVGAGEDVGRRAYADVPLLRLAQRVTPRRYLRALS